MLSLELPIGTEFKVKTEVGTKTYRVVKLDTMIHDCAMCPFGGSDLCDRSDDKVVCCDIDRADRMDVFFEEVKVC